MLALLLAVTLQRGPIELRFADGAISIPEGCSGMIAQGLEGILGEIQCGPRLQIHAISHDCDPCGLDVDTSACRGWGSNQPAAFLKTDAGIPVAVCRGHIKEFADELTISIRRGWLTLQAKPTTSRDIALLLKIASTFRVVKE